MCSLFGQPGVSLSGCLVSFPFSRSGRANVFPFLIEPMFFPLIIWPIRICRYLSWSGVSHSDGAGVFPSYYLTYSDLLEDYRLYYPLYNKIYLQSICLEWSFFYISNRIPRTAHNTPFLAPVTRLPSRPSPLWKEFLNTTFGFSYKEP